MKYQYSGNLDVHDPEGNLRERDPHYLEVWNSEHMTNWLEKPSQEIINIVIHELIPNYQHIRGFAALIYNLPIAETMVFRDESTGEEMPLKWAAEEILLSTSRMKTVQDKLLAYFHHHQKLATQNQDKPPSE
jgi:hypothetical protein